MISIARVEKTDATAVRSRAEQDRRYAGLAVIISEQPDIIAFAGLRIRDVVQCYLQAISNALCRVFVKLSAIHKVSMPYNGRIGRGLPSHVLIENACRRTDEH